ncbi:MAG: hypothetical protein JSU74_06765 [Candidatus Zixiibacteriota bacterium]|nr:MAG: hypothetical protein JSU74_06765 [candidate division Zixibacteria bacterium]
MKGLLLKALVLLLTLTSTVLGQYSFDFLGGGARAEGMGKAYLAVSDDVNAGSWNPAGLYGIEKPVLGFSYNSLRPRGSANVIFPGSSLYTEHSGSSNTLGAIAFAAPVRLKGHPFVGTVNYGRSFDIYGEFGFELSGFGWWPTDRGPRLLWTNTDISYQIDGGVDVLNFGFGTRFYKDISFGVAANVYSGKALEQRVTYDITEEYPYTDSLQITTGELVRTVVDTLKFSGVNFTVGFKYSGEKTNAALVVKTPFTLNVKFDSLYYQLGYINGMIVDDGTDTVYFMNNLVKYDMPWIVGVGLARKIKDNFLVALDAELRAFKGGKVKVRESLTINPGGGNIEEFLEIDPRWENVFTMRFGGEYLFRTGLGEVPLRLGGGFCPVPNPQTDAAGETANPTSYSMSLGTGIHWSQISFDIAYSVSTMDSHVYDGYGTFDFTDRNHHLNFSFTGIF